jgi:bacillithiol biosynthesis cysteine-adding enzyme BshC
MKIDKDFIRIVGELENRLAVLPNGTEIIKLVKKCYVAGSLIQDATFHFVHELFKQQGLVVLIPDSPVFKSIARDIFKDDLLHQRASEIVQGTISKIDDAGYKVQANPREINIFYLQDGSRERIVRTGDRYKVLNTAIEFSNEEIILELDNNPERFSPNVILRGIFQEKILPNIAFIGGGGELAYWLQYGELFKNYNVPLPVLVLRNSFLIAEKRDLDKAAKLGLQLSDFFLSEEKLFSRFVSQQSAKQIKLNGSFEKVKELYEALRSQAAAVDQTLSRHVEALQAKAVDKLIQLEKKMLRAEKRKFVTQQKQLIELRTKLFPAGKLQERHDNVLYYLSMYGTSFIDVVLDNSLSLEQEFSIIVIG